MRIVLTGGGTGGHIYPAISIGQALQENIKDVELLFVGSSHGPEGDIAGKAGFTFKAVPSSPLTMSPSFKNAISLCRLFAGVFRARRILKAFKPDVVIGTGGYTSAAVLLAQKMLGGKVVIHEQNAVPGRTNRWLAKMADRICVSIDSSTAYLPKDKVVVTGLPIRKEFASLLPKVDARRALELNEDLFTLVVVGGSQGARSVNQVVAAAWPMIDDGVTQIFHQAGARNVEEMRENPVAKCERYHIEAFVDTPLAFAAADLVIARSGGTIAEITAVGVPSILFPYPYHRDQHQKKNAQYLVEHGAAIMCEDNITTPQILADIVTGLRSSRDKLSAMASASAALGKVDAAERVVKVILDLGF